MTLSFRSHSVTRDRRLLQGGTTAVFFDEIRWDTPGTDYSELPPRHALSLPLCHRESAFDRELS